MDRFTRRKVNIVRAWLTHATPLLAVALLMVGCVGTTTTGADTTPAETVSPPLNASGAVAQLVSDDDEVSIADVAARVSPAVVNLTTTTRPRAELNGSGVNSPNEFFFRRFFGPDIEGLFGAPGRGPGLGGIVRRGVGSGVIVSPDGFILTNNHIVEDADRVSVELNDGREFDATVVGTDPPSDLALIHIDADDLPSLPLGDSSQLRVGEIVLALGNPFGVGQTVTMGIVSALGRTNVGITEYDDFIQTDASINPGNSGGALVNLNGELVGINTAIATRNGSSAGVGFAIPSNMAQEIMTALRTDGRVARGWLGVGIQELSPTLAQSFGVPEGTRGVLLSEVMPGTPAATAGLQAGDVILSVNGSLTRDPGHLRTTIAMLGAGTEAELVILRDGHERNLTARLGELPAERQVAATGGRQAGPGATVGGVSVAPAAEDDLTRAGASADDHGVLVTNVAPGSAAAEAGLRRGDIILEINSDEVSSVEDVQDALTEESVVVRIIRQGHRLFIAWG